MLIRRHPETKTMKVTELSPAPYNPRSITDEAMKGLSASIERFGLVQPIIWNERTKRVVGGHQRLKVLQANKVTETSVIVVDLPESEEKALNVALNSPAISGEFTDALDDLLREIKELEPELYGDLLLDQLLAEAAFPGTEGMTDPDAIPEPPDEAVSKRGEVYRLGNHRLLCGDSAVAEDVDRLLAGSPVHLVNTDPPYNVKVEPRSNNAIAAGLSSFKGTTHHQALDLSRHPEKARPTGKMRPKDRPLENDFVSDEEFGRLLRAWFGNIARVLLPGRAFYLWGGYSNCGNYPPVLKETGLYFSQAIIWDKEHPVLSRKDFMGAHEWCFYGWREGAAHQFFGPANAQDLWHVKKINPMAMIHLTEKPVELARLAMEYSSRPGENVLDLFGGSGSTLIGAEMTGRKAFLMEIDPAYCDVIRRRWAEFREGEGCDWQALTPPLDA
jgi:DNA modification methylase